MPLSHSCRPESQCIQTERVAIRGVAEQGLLAQVVTAVAAVAEATAAGAMAVGTEGAESIRMERGAVVVGGKEMARQAVAVAVMGAQDVRAREARSRWVVLAAEAELEAMARPAHPAVAAVVAAAQAGEANSRKGPAAAVAEMTLGTTGAGEQPVGYAVAVGGKWVVP